MSAQQKGSSEALREFGATLATSMQMMPPTEPKAEAREEHDKLAKLSGIEFDREFLKGTVEDHEKDIAMFQAVADAKNGAASDPAAKQLPMLKKHLDIAQALQKGMPPANL